MLCSYICSLFEDESEAGGSVAPDPKRSRLEPLAASATPLSSIYTAKAPLGLSNGFLFDCVLLLVHWAPSDLTQVQDMLYLNFFLLVIDMIYLINFCGYQNFNRRFPQRIGSCGRSFSFAYCMRFCETTQLNRALPLYAHSSSYFNFSQLLTGTFSESFFGYLHSILYCNTRIRSTIHEIYWLILLLSSQFSDLAKALNLKLRPFVSSAFFCSLKFSSSKN